VKEENIRCRMVMSCISGLMSKIAILIFCFFSLSCDQGLAPPGISSISGRITFLSKPTDSVKILALVLVQAPAPYTALQLIQGFNTTVLPFSLSTTSFRDTSYTIFVKPDSLYHYLGIAQNYGSNLLTDWRVVAFVHDENDSAVTFLLKQGEQKEGVDLRVRFDSLPRQPFIN
jgi:hypothetical protein